MTNTLCHCHSRPMQVACRAQAASVDSASDSYCSGWCLPSMSRVRACQVFSRCQSPCSPQAEELLASATQVTRLSLLMERQAARRGFVDTGMQSVGEETQLLSLVMPPGVGKQLPLVVSSGQAHVYEEPCMCYLSLLLTQARAHHYNGCCCGCCCSCTLAAPGQCRSTWRCPCSTRAFMVGA